MFPFFLDTQQQQLDVLANNWLNSGAAAFSIWSGDKLLAGWPQGVEQDGPFISVTIQIGETPLGELRVKGITDGSAMRARLQAEAGLISVIMALTSLKSEFEMARRVQLSLLPQNAPQVDGLDIWVASKPASLVSGDFYDFFEPSKRPFNFTVGDISGKGLPAALLMSMIHNVLRDSSQSLAETTPESILLRTNSRVYDDFVRAGMFATVFCGQYNQEHQELLYANAGHSPVIYYDSCGKARLLKADGTALGILPESQSHDQHLKLQNGDVIVVATDGLSDANNPQGERFGYDRLLNCVEMLGSRSSQDIVKGLFSAIEEFSAGASQTDDQTIFVMRCVSP
jgi:sigma-B regulation protein RsbU (phosphoserine phosphatase)